MQPPPTDETGPDIRSDSIVRSDPCWPESLASVDVEPAQLWRRGVRDWLELPRKIAIVGSRSPTPYGVSQARRFGSAFARRGICVVSGLARGIDAAAHEGALDAGGPTIAVLGSCVDKPWPAGPLATRMGLEGLLLSEFPPGTSPRRHHFPLRNRIIAALSDAVLVVEAAEASGSLITARWAADQGQDVFALPGRVDHPMAAGTLRLVRDGATPVGSPEMLLNDLYGPEAEPEAEPEADADATTRTQQESLPFGSRTPAPTDSLETSLLERLRGETLSASELSDLTERGVGEVLASLTSLVLSGKIRRCPGGLYAE